MKQETFNAYNKYRILKHGKRTGNISETCEIFGISRTTFYQWKNAYEQHGMKGLEVKEPKAPDMPNKVSAAVEREILNYVKLNPADGPRRIYYELKSEDFEVGESGVYNVLKRNTLTTRDRRMAYAKQSRSTSGSNSEQRSRQRQKQMSIRRGLSLNENYPGYLVLQRLEYMGKFEGIGKIYQYTIYDTDSKWVFAKIFNRKVDIDVWDFFEAKLVYLMRTFNLDVANLLTEKSKAYVSFFVKNDRYKDLKERYGIEHQFLSTDQMPLVADMDAFHLYLVKTFYEEIGSSPHLDSFINVERALQRTIRHYNFKETIKTGPHKGKVPARVVLARAEAKNIDMNTLPLWVMALIDPLKEGEEENDANRP